MSSEKTPKYWQQRAATMRTLATQTDDAKAKAQIVDVADGYDKLALRAQSRAELKQKV